MIVIQNSTTKGCHEFHVKPHKNLEILKLETPAPLLTRVILYKFPLPLHKIKCTLLVQKKIMNEKNFFTKSDVIF